MKYDNFGFRTHTDNPHSDSFFTVYVGGDGFMRGDFESGVICKGLHPMHLSLEKESFN